MVVCWLRTNATNVYKLQSKQSMLYSSTYQQRYLVILLLLDLYLSSKGYTYLDDKTFTVTQTEFTRQLFRKCLRVREFQRLVILT